MDYTIYTIGGGEFLINIFKGLSALSGHKAYLSMAKVAILFGLLWILFEVTFTGMFKRGIQWFFTMFLMFNILFVPKVTVIVEDKLNPNIAGRNIIQGVPFALGVVGHFTSIIGDKATELMETAFGSGNDLPYNKYGMIAPINVADSVTRAKITNTDFAKTMRHFMHQCVFYDLVFKRYSIEDMAEQEDLWQFLSSNASKSRAFTIHDGNSANIEFCNEGIIKLQQANYWKKESTKVKELIKQRLYPHLNKYAGDDIITNGWNTWHGQLHSIGGDAEKAIQQAMVINAFKDSAGSFGGIGNIYAQARSDVQTRMTYDIIRKQAQSWVPILGAVMQGLLYGAFPMVFLLMLLPIGVSVAKNYFAMFLWIESWGPVYAIINSILMTYGGSKYGAETIQYGGSFTLGSHAGIMEVNQNIASVAGNMILFIPFIAAGLMWGVRSFTSLATSMLSTPMQSAQEAAREASTGNISLGNVSVGNMNYDNMTGNKLHDSVSIDTGRQQAVLSGGGVVQMTGSGKTTLDLSNAYTRNPGFETSYFDNQSSQLSEAATHSQNSGVTNAIQSSESKGKGIDAYAQAVLNHGKQSNWSDGYSKNITSDQREALQQYESAINDWSQNHNMSKEDTVRLFATASSPFKSLIGIGAGAEGSKTSGERGSIDEAKKYMESRNFEQNRSIVEGLAKTQSFSEVDSEGSNLNLTIGEAFKDSAYYDKQARASFDEAESLRKEAQLIETKGSNIKVDTQQPFLEYLTTKRDSFGDQLTMKRASEILSSNQYTSPQDYAIREREYTTFMQKYGGDFVNKYKGDADNVIQDQGAFENKIGKNYTDIKKEITDNFENSSLQNNNEKNQNTNKANNPEQSTKSSTLPTTPPAEQLVTSTTEQTPTSTSDNQDKNKETNKPFEGAVNKLLASSTQLGTSTDNLKTGLEQINKEKNNSPEVENNQQNNNLTNTGQTIKNKGQKLKDEYKESLDSTRAEISANKGNLDKENVKKTVEGKLDPSKSQNHILLQLGQGISEDTANKWNAVYKNITSDKSSNANVSSENNKQNSNEGDNNQDISKNNNDQNKNKKPKI